MSLTDPAYWRAKAEEALAVAEQMPDLEGKALMVEIAGRYVQLAERALEQVPKSRRN